MTLTLPFAQKKLPPELREKSARGDAGPIDGKRLIKPERDYKICERDLRGSSGQNIGREKYRFAC